MNNYLNNIVARSLNAVEVIQPRVPLLFEPVSHVTSAPMPWPSETESLDEYEPTEKPAEDSLDALTDPTIGPVATVVTETPANRVVAAAHLRSRERERTDERNSIQPPANELRQVDPNEELDIKTPTRNDSLTQKRSVVRSRQPDSEGTVNREGKSTASRSRQYHHQPDLGAVPLAAPLKPLSRLASESNGFPTTFPTSGDVRPEQTESPTIRITIGRVDVRALMPAPHSPISLPARPKPNLSLEDYLKQREEGKR